VGAGLRRLVEVIKPFLRDQVKDAAPSPAALQTAEVLQKQFREWGSCATGSDVGDSETSGKQFLMDYILHHRVALATDIVKSMADGQRMSRQRQKVLRSSIDYIEQKL
jgi:hypothetical protein